MSQSKKSADKDYLEGALGGLLSIIKSSSPQNQPTGDVLETYVELLKMRDLPEAELLDELRGRVSDVESALAWHPDRLKKRKMSDLAGLLKRGAAHGT